MSNALRDQLLKAGLVNEKQVKKAAKEKHKDTLRQQAHGKAKSPDEDKLRAQRTQAEKMERDRQLNQQRQEQAEKKAIAAQIRQLVEQNSLDKGDGDTPFNFVDRGKVKRLYVSDDVRKRITLGQLAIVRMEKQYEVVPAETAEKIRVRDADSVVVFNDQKQQLLDDASPDDPYAKFEVPDDLMW